MQIIIPGKPIAKGRPRTAVINGHPVIFTDKQTKQAEKEIRQILNIYKPRIIEAEVPVMLEVCFMIERGKSVKREYPIIRPDIDNYLKTIMDAMNGIAWHDDAQVVKVDMIKKYAPRDPYTVVRWGEFTEAKS